MCWGLIVRRDGRVREPFAMKYVLTGHFPVETERPTLPSHAQLR